MLKDQKQRLLASDPRYSYIVQAPAGSGKTELLTQRYLRLLSTVASPEQIIALTFTRKAASEMRERILKALTRSASGASLNSPHEQLTNTYANEALEHGKRLNWQLLENPRRLRVITIDSLCQMFTHAIPLYEQQAPFANISDNPQLLYELAVRSCLQDALSQENLHPPIKLLLQHLDNRQDKLVQLLSHLLLTRDQWLALLYDAKQQSKETYEHALFLIEQHELMRFLNSIALDYRDLLCSLSQQVASIENNPQSPRYQLRNWDYFEQLDREMATSLAALLLTKEDKLRKGFDHYVGLKVGSCEKSLFQSLKLQSQELLQNLAENPDFLTALIRIKKLPPPFYDEKSWDVLQALFTLLPLLAAHLQLVFRETNEVDFTAVSEQARLALGDDDAPTDLALYLDHSIHHLLVDEFQDTSIQQFQLLSKLVAGWLPQDSKTLFIVGDPMQSIYRFRQAEVGLFLKAKQQGIGPVKLLPLELCCNFRSTDIIVNWVNSQFKTIFPKEDDIELGAISFHPSVSILHAASDSGIYAELCPDKAAEAQAIVALIKQEMQTSPHQRIAILVRSRNQLSELIPLLREKNIPFQGVEIEKLSNLSHLQDIFTLTKALLMPASRLAWLALLRSPWCGINLADLHCIANFDKKKSIFYALSQLSNEPKITSSSGLSLNKLEKISDEGLIRARFIYQVMQNALASRHQQPLINWLSITIEQLHGEKILTAAERADLDQYWGLLARFTQDGQIANWEQFEQQFKALYSQRVTPSALQIMTIHKSKGLEFDSIILPGLGNRAPPHDKPLIRWLKLPSHLQDELILLSPIQSKQNECQLYDYLGDINADKDYYELQRLLYVAATRAKSKLYLFDYHEKAGQNTFRGLLQAQPFLPTITTPASEEITTKTSMLSRLPLSFYQNLCPPVMLNFTGAPPVLLSTNARQSGVIAHELLQWIGDNHPQKPDELPWEIIANRYKSSGFTPIEQQEALQVLHEQIDVLLRSPIGQWLCKQHLEEHNEYELLTKENNQIVTRIIDRTFYEDGYYWIIDFKTGKEDESHRQQVNNYANLLSQKLALPIRCGLYYLTTACWIDWHYAKEPALV